MSDVDLSFDPFRGGFELRQDGRTLLEASARHRGGPVLAQADELPQGVYGLPGPAEVGACEAAYDAGDRLLVLSTPLLVLRVRLLGTPSRLRVRHEDFK